MQGEIGMMIWIKEYFDILTLNGIKRLFSDKVSLRKWESWEAVDRNKDLVLYSGEDSDGFQSEYLCHKAESFVKNLRTVLDNDISRNYDLYYMQNVLDFAENNRIDNVFIGNSYMLHGIENDFFPYSVNTALPSQDMYYSMKIIREILRSGKIKNIIFGMCYYFLFCNLALNDFPELDRVSTVYYPLFKDYHNAVLLGTRPEVSLKSEVLDIDGIYAGLRRDIGIQYFHPERSRECCRMKLWSDESKKWPELDEEQKRQIVAERLKMHNRLLKYAASFKENVQLFEALTDLCRSEGIRLSIVVPPATKYYTELLDERFKELMYGAINRLGLQDKVLDLFTDKRFSDADFVDTDHLNDDGARKFSQIVSEYLKH